MWEKNRVKEILHPHMYYNTMISKGDNVVYFKRDLDYSTISYIL